MGQLDLGFDAPLHRERDRPPAIKPGDTVHLTRWEWYWDRWYPWTAKGGES